MIVRRNQYGFYYSFKHGFLNWLVVDDFGNLTPVDSKLRFGSLYTSRHH